MFKYWWIMLASAIFALSGCSWEQVTDMRATYPIQNITAYRGQSLAALFDDNGAPNSVHNLDNGDVMWIYYTNYRPLGGGELITYNPPRSSQQGLACSVKVILHQEIVAQVYSTCY